MKVRVTKHPLDPADEQEGDVITVHLGAGTKYVLREYNGRLRITVDSYEDMGVVPLDYRTVEIGEMK